MPSFKPALRSSMRQSEGGGILGQEGIRGPIKKPDPPSVEPFAPVSNRFVDAAHAARFFLAWMSNDEFIELDDALRNELARKLFSKHISGALPKLIRAEIQGMSPDQQKRVLAGLLDGRWMDLLPAPL